MSNWKIFFLFLLISCGFNYAVLAGGVLIAPDNDAIYYNYPLKSLFAYAVKNLEFPLWSPYEFIGFPFFAEIQKGSFYPINLILYFLLPAPFAFNLSIILHLALAGFFTFLYVRLVGVGTLPAFMAGVVFGFTGFVISNKDHTAIMNSAAWLPLLMYFLEKLRRTPAFKYSLFISLLVAVQVFAGNFQICFYTYLTAGLFLLYYARGNKRFFLLGISGMALGFLIASPQIYATMELSGLSWLGNTKSYRGYEFFSLYKVYLATLPGFFFPRLFDGWGPKDATLPMMGVLPLVVALIVAIREFRADSRVRFWGIVAVVSLLLSLGTDTPIGRLLYHAPFYNTFRANGRNLFEFTFAVSVLFAIGINTILGEHKRAITYLKSLAFVMGSIFCLSVLFFFALPYLPLEGVIQSLKDFQRAEELLRLSLRLPAVYIPILTMAGYLTVLLLFRRFPSNAIRYVLIIAVVVEGFYFYGFGRISGPMLKEAENLCLSELYGPLISRDRSLYRIANIYRAESDLEPNVSANLTCRVGSVNAYDPLCIKEYSELLELWHGGLFTDRWDKMVSNNIVLSMLGVKYISVARDYDMDFNGITASSESPKREDVPLVIGPVNGLNKGSGDISAGVTLSDGVYVVSLKAKAKSGADGTLSAWILPTSGRFKYSVWDRFRRDYVLDDGAEPGAMKVLEAVPDFMTEEFGEFHQVFRMEGATDPTSTGVTDPTSTVILKLKTASEKTIEVKDIRLERIVGYLPTAMTAPAGEEVYQRLTEDEDYAVYLNKNHLPPAWPVERLMPVGDFTEVKKKLDLLEVNPLREAMIYRSDIEGLRLDGLSRGDVSVERSGMNDLLIKARFPAEGFIVLSEQYYPGWRAFIDGRETKIYRVNGILRGVSVPGGEHSIVFRYRPRKIMLLMGLSLALTLSALAYIAIKR